MNQGESAENAVIREISEELGAKTVSVQFNQSQYFEPSNTLLLNFSCMLEHAELHPNEDCSESEKEFLMSEYHEINKLISMLCDKRNKLFGNK